MKEKAVLEMFVTVEKAAMSLDCTDQFIYQLIGAGKIKGIKMGSRAIRVSVASLHAYIQESWIDPDTYRTGDVEEEINRKGKPQGTQKVARSSFMTSK